VGLRPANYTANLLNQYSQRTVPGYVDILGVASATNLVYVNSQIANRKGEYFWKELSMNNTTGSVWQPVTVTATGLTTVTGNVFVAKTPEVFSYDLDGNMISDGRWNYTWDAENRLIKVESRPDTPSSSWRRIEWTYDALGRRIQQVTSIWTNNAWFVVENLKFVSDPMLFGRQIVELNGTNNTLVRSYAWGLDLGGTMDGAGGVGGLAWVTLHTASGPASGTQFVCYDGNGNIVSLVSATTGDVTARYEYGPFGEPIRVSGPAAALNPFRFSTKRTDNTTDFVLYEYRIYSPSTGRWLSRDPIEEQGGRNLCAFVANAPLNNYDVLGWAGCSPCSCTTSGTSTSDEGGWCGALKRLKDWCLGNLPPEEVFGPESRYTQEIARSAIAQKLRNAFLEKNKGKPCSEWRAYTDADLKFGLKEFICDLGNGTAHFVGSADGHVYIMGYRCRGARGAIVVEYRIRNTTSLKSALYHCIPEACNPTTPNTPCSNYTNEYYWYETYECICCFLI